MKTMIVMWIHIYSTMFNIDPYLVEAVVKVESSYNPLATGTSHGEIGLMQMRPEYLESPHLYYDPKLNLYTGIKRLSNLQRLKPDLGENWFCAWNLGPTGALKKKKMGKLKDYHYCKKVKKYRNELIAQNKY